MLVTLVALLSLKPATVRMVGKPSRPDGVVIVSWDGGADWVIDRLVSEGKLPNVARMAREGAMADAIRPAFPSKTAVSHFSLFSGTWPESSGVTGNEAPILPRSEHTVQELVRGFDAGVHLTEPLWVSAAKAGAQVLALSAAGSYPPAIDQNRLTEAGVPLSRYREFSGFESGISNAQVITELPGNRRIQFGDTAVELSLIDDPRDPVKGLDTLVAVMGSNGRRSKTIRVKPAPAGDRQAWSIPIPVSKGDLRGITYLRLFELDPKSGRMVLYARASAAIRGTESDLDNQAYLEAYGGFHDDPFGPYQAGLLGPTLYDATAGKGEAEKRVLECVALDLEFAKRSFRYGWKRWKSNLVFHYTPQSDNAGHCWMGLLDPALASHRPEVARRIWPFYEQVFRLQDDWLGDMMRAAGKKTGFVLVSDHGMAGSEAIFNVNEVLRQAGLLAVDAAGNVDLSKTKALAPRWGEFFVCVNGTDRKGGIVPSNESEAVLAAAEKALLAAKDDQGKAVVKRVIRAKGLTEFRFGGPAGGDLAFELRPGVYPRARVGKVLEPVAGPRYAGVHGFWPTQREMHSIGYFWGPGVVAGSRLRAGNAVDISPTICEWMGWPTPAGVEGRTLMRFR